MFAGKVKVGLNIKELTSSMSTTLTVNITFDPLFFLI